MKNFFLLLCLLFSSDVFSQTNSIIGLLSDADNGKSIPGGNIFISNSSKGTITDTAGRFTLSNIAEGNSYELVVSSVGYETFTYSFSSIQLPLNLHIKLNRKVVAMDNVVIVAPEVDGWKKWGPLFLRNFLGSSENASSCKIENIDAIKFRRYKKENLLEVTADDILIIKNHQLGYIIKFQLEQFIYDFKNQQVTYLGYPLFDEINKDAILPGRFVKRRKKAYYGSLMHFVRCLYNNRLVPEGFEVRRMQRVTVYDTIFNGHGNHGIVMYDSAGKKMKPPPYFLKRVEKELIGAAVLNSDSLLFAGDDNKKNIFSFSNWLLVRYVNEYEPFEFTRDFGNRRPQDFQASNLIIVNDEKRITIQADGNFYLSTELLMDGYLGWEKIGDLLPLDYYPEQKTDQSGSDGKLIK